MNIRELDPPTFEPILGVCIEHQCVCLVLSSEDE